MSPEWLQYPIYVDDQLVIAGHSDGPLDINDIFNRMETVFDGIESTRCDGRLMNVSIFWALEELEEQIKHRGVPSIDRVTKLAAKIGEYFGFDQIGKTNTSFVRKSPTGDEYEIRIEKTKLIKEERIRLDDYFHLKSRPWWKFW